MDQKTIALKLGLPETATEEEIIAKLGEMTNAQLKVASLEKEKEALTLGAITQAVESAIAEKRLGEDRKEQFIKLGKSIGIDELKKTLEAMSQQVKLSKIIGHQGGAAVTDAATYKKLSDVPEDELETMRESDKKTYAKLYKAEYGMDCEF